MNDSLSTRGLVATVPNHIVTGEGLPITSFRLAASQRKFNRSTQSWENGETNWYTVTAFRQLAINLAACVTKGDRVVVSGRLAIRDWQNGERSGTVVEIDADGVGHDLTWGTASFSRTLKRADAPGVGEGAPAAGESGGGAWSEADEPIAGDGLLNAEAAGEGEASTDLDGRLELDEAGDALSVDTASAA